MCIYIAASYLSLTEEEKEQQEACVNLYEVDVNCFVFYRLNKWQSRATLIYGWSSYSVSQSLSLCVCVTQMEFLTFNIVDSDVCALARTVALVTFIQFAYKKKGNCKVDCWHMFFAKFIYFKQFLRFLCWLVKIFL